MPKRTSYTEAERQYYEFECEYLQLKGIVSDAEQDLVELSNPAELLEIQQDIEALKTRISELKTNMQALRPQFEKDRKQRTK